MLQDDSRTTVHALSFFHIASHITTSSALSTSATASALSYGHTNFPIVELQARVGLSSVFWTAKKRPSILSVHLDEGPAGLHERLVSLPDLLPHPILFRAC